MESSKSFTNSITNPKVIIPVVVDSMVADGVSRNSAIVKTIAESVIVCGCQCTGLHSNSQWSPSSRDRYGMVY